MVDEKPHPYDPTFTDNVINATGPGASPRMKEVVSSLIKHLHAFARDIHLTVPEWMAAVELVNEAGRMSTPQRNEGQLLCDVLGLESLVDEITFAQFSSSLAHSATPGAIDPVTSSAILGPFWRANAPKLPMGASIVTALPPSIPESDIDHTLLHGVVRSAATGEPIAGAEIDLWHTAPNGLYEQQDDEQPDMNLRGIFTTGADGKFEIYCLRPTSYPIPFDGPAGQLLKMLDRHPMRPAHIHFIVTAPGCTPLTTQIFDRRDKYITDDAVFAVKESLVCEFKERKGDPKADWELEYNFLLADAEEKK